MWQRPYYCRQTLLAILLNLAVTSPARVPKIGAFFTTIECPPTGWDLVQESGCMLTPGVDSTMMMNAHFTLSRDVSNVTAQFKFLIERNGKYETYVSTELDICEALGQLHQNLLLKLIAHDVRRSSNFPIQCPLKKNIQYYLRNYSISSDILPGYTPELNFASFTDYFYKDRKAMTLNTWGKVLKINGKRKRN